jgi:LysM repeat protein
MSKIDIVKENLQFQQLLHESSSTAILRDEYLIPDTHPDVQAILTVEARPIITSKEIIGNKVMVEGRVEYNALYIPRDDNMVVNSIIYNEKFTNSLDLGEDEHKLVCEVDCKVEHIDAKIMNERKIAIEGIIGLNWYVYKSTEFDFVKNVEASEGIEVLKKIESINRLVASKDTELIGKSMIRVGMDKPQISKILKSSMRLHKREVKMGEDKVYLGCYCRLNILYLGDETNEIISLEDDVYISKEEEVIGIFIDMIPSVTYEMKNSDVVIEEDDLGEARIINSEFLVGAKIKVFSDENIDIIKDAYSPKFPIELRKDTYEIGAILGTKTNDSIIKDNIYLKEGDIKPERIIAASGNLIITDKTISQDRITVEGIIRANIMYKTADEEIGFSEVSAEVPFTSVIDMLGAKEGMKAIIKSSLENEEASLEANTIAFKATISLTAKVFYETAKEFISDVIELDGEAPKKNASIAIYVVGNGDTLWDLAKKYNCTVDDLINMNQIENPDNITEGEKLIIPGRAIFN